jgi:hypothetical protein
MSDSDDELLLEANDDDGSEEELTLEANDDIDDDGGGEGESDEDTLLLEDNEGPLSPSCNTGRASDDRNTGPSAAPVPPPPAAVGAAPPVQSLRAGDAVLCPNEEGELMPASIVDPHSAGISSSDVPAESRAIRFAKSRFAEISGVFFMGEKNIIPWAGFVERLLDGCTRSGGVAPTGRAVAAATARPGDSILFSVWRAEIHVEGFFSLLLWTIGFLEHERQARPHAQLLVDWTDERITFSQADGRTDAHANAWNDFFYQPVAPTDGKDGKDGKEAAAAAEPLASEVHEAAQRDRLRVVNHCGRPRFFAKFADFRGAQPVPEGFKGKVVGGGQITGGRVDEATAASGRAAFKRWLQLRPQISDRVDAIVRDQLEGRMARSGVRLVLGGSSATGAEVGEADGWLAVHIRRTDKLQMCAPNRNLSVSTAAQQAASFARSLHCGGVLLCSDDALFRDELAAALASHGLVVATVDVLLSAKPNVQSHMAVGGLADRRRNAKDCLVEALVMSRCRALLSSWSNVSVGVIFFSPPGFRHFMFGDAPPPTTESRKPMSRGDAANQSSTAAAAVTATLPGANGVAADASSSLLLQQVQLHGLKAKPELNGCRGQALSFDEASGRWEVLLRGRGTAKTVMIKPANLERVRSPPPPPDGWDAWPESLLTRWHEDGGVVSAARARTHARTYAHPSLVRPFLRPGPFHSYARARSILMPGPVTPPPSPPSFGAPVAPAAPVRGLGRMPRVPRRQGQRVDRHGGCRPAGPAARAARDAACVWLRRAVCSGQRPERRGAAALPRDGASAGARRLGMCRDVLRRRRPRRPWALGYGLRRGRGAHAPHEARQADATGRLGGARYLAVGRKARRRHRLCAGGRGQPRLGGARAAAPQ